jgi:hypothetical protein
VDHGARRLPGLGHEPAGASWASQGRVCAPDGIVVADARSCCRATGIVARLGQYPRKFEASGHRRLSSTTRWAWRWTRWHSTSASNASGLTSSASSNPAMTSSTAAHVRGRAISRAPGAVGGPARELRHLRRHLTQRGRPHDVAVARMRLRPRAWSSVPSHHGCGLRCSHGLTHTPQRYCCPCSRRRQSRVRSFALSFCRGAPKSSPESSLVAITTPRVPSTCSSSRS